MLVHTIVPEQKKQTKLESSLIIYDRHRQLPSAAKGMPILKKAAVTEYPPAHTSP